jgi:hypothetical protein
MIRSLSHDAVEVRQQDVLAVVQLPASVPGNNAKVRVFSPALRLSDPSPVNAGFAPSVEAVYRASGIPDFGQPVVMRRVMDVVNLNWLLAMSNKVGNAVLKIFCSAVSQIAVSIFSERSGSLAGSLPTNPGEHPRVRVVGESIADRVWDNVYSHLKLPLDLVRGSVVGATDTPILRQIAHKLNIGGLNG